jgi:phenylacetate-CoA ligase
MIRYRTRDITALIPEPCPCGRTLRRMRRIGRRSDDMIVLRGVNVFPSQIESALLSVEGTLPHYQIVLTRDKGLDRMEVLVEVTPEVFGDQIGALENLHDKLICALDRTLGLRVAIRLVRPQTILRSEGKAQRVVDRRKLE